MIRLSARDGHELDAYEARPDRQSVGGIVVVQEIFGVTDHIKRVADRYAAAGFHAIAPAMFDRIERGIVLAYSDVERGRAAMRRLEWPNTLQDLEAAAVGTQSGLSIGVVGFCWGGTVAHVAAAELPVAAGVAYYGSGIARLLDRKPKCPVMYHFGDQDSSIPTEDIDAIRRAYPEGIYHVYSGVGHGFSCEDRQSYSLADAQLAFERSVAFLHEHVT